MKPKFKILAIFLIIILFLVLIFIPKVNNEKIKQVCFNSTCVDVELAVSQEQQELGLMFRNNLSRGMLFIYDEEKDLSFWMKNTLIPLDIIWINSNLEITAIEQASQCSDSCQIYTHQGQYVLEVNSNFTSMSNLKIGDNAKFQR
ncbi:MAG: DUF192 domain-containing protein [Candidatus Pacearchaeota archaeon]|nr:DUF192 domain-containing protein [Candidatus Pacearchaeota archaeon]